MKVLLDTHVFIWWASEPAKLSQPVTQLLATPAQLVYLSAASVWEIVIKQQLGKLTLHRPLVQIIAEQRANGISILPVRLDHVLAVSTLPPVHKDPFDRILVAQALTEAATLISADPVFGHYSVPVIW